MAAEVGYDLVKMSTAPALGMDVPPQGGPEMGSQARTGPESAALVWPQWTPRGGPGCSFRCWGLGNLGTGARGRGI